ncbi:N-acetylgalactosamine-6-sulfatase [Haloferula helveola]|uniref:N-acetylgalactosamine-6-sulfatase n=1 Tax=Haloferula helveola TaxID=490095 RepID=A0ABN6H0B7_9BACT|nr:N-acetylgalactosamine-6-sulfatase [Haloferula helveola]
MKPILCLALFLCSATLPVLAKDDRPNIIVIMADDMGYADAGFTGATDIKTPHLDALAASGVVFRQGYVTHPFCGPSRAGLLSGRYQHRFGFETNPAYDASNPYMGIDPAEVLFPKHLQDAGYRTGVIGKWHLGSAPAFHPNHRGFDYFYGFLGGGHDYISIDLRKPVAEGYLQALERNGMPAAFDGYLTTALSEDAAGFVRDSGDRPFFLYLAYNAPHAPLQAPKEAIGKYAHIEDRNRRIYAAMVDVMDAGIGKVVSALEDAGHRDNTLIFFLSDNGGPQAGPDSPSKGNGSSNKPFRGGKGDVYDGGIHVPFIASWPARIPAGSSFEHPVIALDIAKTALACAGTGRGVGSGLEGVDLVPHLTGETDSPPHDMLFWKNGPRWAVLSSKGDKLLSQGKGKAELYRLPEDVSESRNLAREETEQADRLKTDWMGWNEGNVPCRLMPYKAYHRDRDAFFLEAIPGDATKAGYRPGKVSTFK